MADSAIGSLPSIGTVADDDVLAIVDTSANLTKKVSASAMRAALGVDGWREIASSKYTALPTSSSTIAMTDTSDFAVGMAVRWTQSGTDYYGIVSAVSASTSITVHGPALSTSVNITALYAGDDSRIVQRDVLISGNYGDGAADLIASDNKSAWRWNGPAAHLVHFAAIHNSDDTGANQPKVNVKVGGNAVSTNDSNNGVQVGTTWQDNPAAEVNASNYAVSNGDAIEIACTVAGSNGDASDLTVGIVFVLD